MKVSYNGRDIIATIKVNEVGQARISVAKCDGFAKRVRVATSLNERRQGTDWVEVGNLSDGWERLTSILRSVQELEDNILLEIKMKEEVMEGLQYLLENSEFEIEAREF